MGHGVDSGSRATLQQQQQQQQQLEDPVGVECLMPMRYTGQQFGHKERRSMQSSRAPTQILLFCLIW